MNFYCPEDLIGEEDRKQVTAGRDQQLVKMPLLVLGPNWTALGGVGQKVRGLVVSSRFATQALLECF